MENNEIMAKVEHLMDTAEYAAESVFDRVTILRAKFENGMELVEAHISDSAEEFNPEKGVEACMMAMWGKLAAMEQAKEWEPALTEQQAKIIVALAENSLKVTGTAQKLNYDSRTIRYHVKKIHEQTGVDPMSFFGMCELLMEARRVLAVEG